MKSSMSRITGPTGARARQARKLSVLSIVALLLCWPIPIQVQAAAGALDPTFGIGGKVITRFFDTSGGIGEAHAIAIQPDGKIVAAGGTDNLGNFTGDFALARYNKDGSLDTAFGSDGKVTTDFTVFDQVNALAIQPGGKIIAVGFVRNFITFDDFVVARYNSDGTLDTGFGIGGKVTTDFGSSRTDEAHATLLQPDGKIVVVGSSVSGGTSDFALARYNTDGSLDASFGNGGKVITDIVGFFDKALDGALQPDGKIIAAGFTIS